MIAESDDIVEQGGYAISRRKRAARMAREGGKTASDRACPHGVQFYDLVIDGRRLRAAWRYEAPRPAMSHVAGRFGFWNEVAVVEPVRLALVRPNSRCSLGVSCGVRRSSVPMTTAYINRIATAVPPNNVHAGFVRLAETLLPDDRRQRTVFRRMAELSGIERRYSFLTPASENDTAELDSNAFYVRGQFPSTAVRMRLFNDKAPGLAASAVEQLELGSGRDGLTHLLITCCTGFTAPGLDLELVERCKLPPSIERTIVGFMGCYAAINALKLARHIVRSDPQRANPDREFRALHAAPSRHERSRQASHLPSLGRRLRRIARQRGPAGHRARQFPRRAFSRHGRNDAVGYRRQRLRHDSLRQRARDDRAGRSRSTATRSWRARTRKPSNSGRFIPAAGPSSTPSSAPSPSRLRRWRRHGACCAISAICRPRPSCSSLRSCSLPVKRNAAGCGMAFGPGLMAETMLFRTGGAA